MKKVIVLFLFVSSIALAQNNRQSLDNYYVGLLPGKFSVSPTQTVRFSKGNLQFRASTKEWQFAENQYDYIGEDPDKLGGVPLENIDGWIDLFWWGQNGLNGVYPGDEDYVSLAIEGPSPFDWGYELINNGGSFNNMWRSLSLKEWRYLIEKRKDAKIKFSTAKVCGIKGLVLLPDDWTLPSGCVFREENVSFKAYADDDFFGGWIIESSNYANNVYNKSQWEKMEKNGAVFLPAADDLNGFGLGWYWTSTAYEQEAEEIVFDAGHLYTCYEPKYKSNGLSVRLVQNNSNVLYFSPSLFLTKLIDVYEKGNRIIATFDHFVASDRILISPDTYLITNTGIKTRLISTEGIKIAPDMTEFDKDLILTHYHFTLEFEALPEQLTSYDSFSIIEEDSDWQWINIRIR